MNVPCNCCCAFIHLIKDQIMWHKNQIENYKNNIIFLEKEIDEHKKKGDAKSTHMINMKQKYIYSYYTDNKEFKEKMLILQEELAEHKCHK